VTAWSFLGHVSPAVGCPGRNSRRPGLGWCRRSIGERRWLIPLGYTTDQGCWMLPRRPGSRRQEMFCCIPGWHVCTWSHRYKDWGVGTWDGRWCKSRARRFVNVDDLVSCDVSTHNHSVSDCSGDWSTSGHSNRSWTNVARSWFLFRTETASQNLGITSLSAVVQWVSCRTTMKALFL